MLELDQAGQLKRFRYNNTDRTSLCNLSSEQIEQFYEHQRALDAAIINPANGIRIKVSSFYLFPCGGGGGGVCVFCIYRFTNAY